MSSFTGPTPPPPSVQALKERAVNYLLFKGVFAAAVLSGSSEWIIWSVWFSVVGFMNLTAFLCRHRSEYVRPTTGSWWFFFGVCFANPVSPSVCVGCAVLVDARVPPSACAAVDAAGLGVVVRLDVPGRVHSLVPILGILHADAVAGRRTPADFCA